MTTTTYALEPYAVTGKETDLCSRCNALIVWQTSYRTGKKYRTDIQARANEIVTARNWFHECKAVQLPLLPEQTPAKYEPIVRSYRLGKVPAFQNTKDEKRRAMILCIEQASESQLRRALEVLFNRQTLSEQVSNSTTQNNKIGFSGLDAEILSDIYKKSKQYGSLRGKQVDLVRRKMKRYARQLVDAVDKGEWRP